MGKAKALQNLSRNKATNKEIELLKRALTRGEISIPGDVNNSVIIIGSGNKVELTAEALSLLKPETKIEEQVEGNPPYMGLRYYDTQDADLFYGREALTHELFVRTQKESFLAIVGASGSGKSSVARAGLIPLWMKENERAAIRVISPATYPLESLAASLTRESESVTETSALMDDMKKDSRSLRLFVKKAFGEMKFLLLVDQFEETFTLCKDINERKAFIENLLALGCDGSSARVVITLRADFYHYCAEYKGLRQALQIHQAYIGAMTVDEMRHAITKPAENNGWDFQSGLVELIRQDVGTEPGALPLLSHALLEMWKRRQGNMLTLQGYHEAGGVKKAIAQTAESVYEMLTFDEQTIARRIFLRLTELGEGTQDTRRRVRMHELVQIKEQESLTKVLKTLTDARLVTTEQDSVEVAHEALIREWGTLRRWLEEDRDGLRIHRRLTANAEEWARRKRESSELYRGARLKQVQNWMKEHSDSLSPLEKDFLKASQNVKKLEIIQWFSIAIAGMALLLLVIFMPAGIINRLIYTPERVMPEEDWVTIPAGEFRMGSENDDSDEVVHKVYLNTYQIWRYEITNKQFNHCIRAGVCTGTAVADKLDHPVTGVNWFQAKAYCGWVGGSLPTEAEWEKAARGTDTRVYPWGEGIDCGKANYAVGSYCVGDTAPVGSYESGKSPYDVYDMAGNVLEWVNDWYGETYYQNSPFSNPLGPETGTYRVLRGGAWNLDAFNLRSITRIRSYPTNSNFNFGFRCSRSQQ